MVYATTPTHEVRRTIPWDHYGDAPYWATCELVLAADGGGTFAIDVDDLDEGIEHVSPGYTVGQNG